MEYEYILSLICLSLLFQLILSVDRDLPLHGRFVLKRFSDNQCKINPVDTSIGTIEQGNQKVCMKLPDSITMQVIQWDQYSNSLKFHKTNNLADCEVLKEEEIKHSLLCNGSCIKMPLFKDMDKYYTCVFNNIIDSALVEIVRYQGEKQCKDNLTLNKTYNGNDLCWEAGDSSTNSILPGYWDDDRKRLFYTYVKDNEKCNRGSLNVSDTYFTCNGGCFTDKVDPNTSYTCNFNNNGKSIYLGNLILITLLLIYFL